MNLSSNQQFILLLVSICGVITLISKSIGRKGDNNDDTEEIK